MFKMSLTPSEKKVIGFVLFLALLGALTLWLDRGSLRP